MQRWLIALLTWFCLCLGSAYIKMLQPKSLKYAKVWWLKNYKILSEHPILNLLWLWIKAQTRGGERIVKKNGKEIKLINSARGTSTIFRSHFTKKRRLITNISETKLLWFVQIPRWTSLTLIKYYSLLYCRTIVLIATWKGFVSRGMCVLLYGWRHLIFWKIKILCWAGTVKLLTFS